MKTINKDIQQQYQGYLKTPLLWMTSTICNLTQLDLPIVPTAVFDGIILDNLRLGKRVEQFVFTDLKHRNNVSILKENIQIQDDKITVGELDCLLKVDEQSIHLEIVYKFYLYDATVGTTEFEHWIGPNRNDSLVKKVEKLKSKQLPLLYNKCTEPLLDELQISKKDVKQRILFKGQLFIPYKSNISIELLNKECLIGFYIHYSEISQFENCKFYIPSKINWLIQTHPNVTWLQFETFKIATETMYKNETSPLCWIKFPNGTIQKFFVVWWK